MYGVLKNYHIISEYVPQNFCLRVFGTHTCLYIYKLSTQAFAASMEIRTFNKTCFS